MISAAPEKSILAEMICALVVKEYTRREGKKP
jgi:hypothetical protein